MRVAPAVLAALLLLPALAAAQGPLAGRYEAQSLSAARSLVHLDRAWLGLTPPWELAPAGRGVRIGLIDTGLDPTHPDLRGAMACAGCWRDFTPAARPAPYDDHGHGTHVAGILAARGHLQADPLGAYWLTGARGLAPEARLLVAKAMDARGEGSDEQVAHAIAWVLDPDGDPATDDGADIINLSIGIDAARAGAQPGGGAPLGTRTRDAVAAAARQGVVVVASSGNDGQARVREPGDVPGVLTVAAVDAAGRMAPFSNVGPGLDLLAPGILVSTYPRALDRLDGAQDGYAAMAGTSMAAPVVAGAVALLMEADPTLRPGSPQAPDPGAAQRVHDLLLRTARPLHDARTSAGLLDAQGALAAAGAGPRPVLWEVAGPLLALLAALALLGGRGALRLREVRRERALVAAYHARRSRGPPPARAGPPAPVPSRPHGAHPATSGPRPGRGAASRRFLN